MSKIRLTMKNFRSYKEGVIEFGEGINIITGESDQGKSVIIKALDWVFRNNPSGDSVRSTWSKNKGTTEVEVNFLDEDLVIKRIKSKTENKYIMNGEEFTGFGNKVPNPIKEALNIEDINIQGQTDNFFLFKESAPEVGRYLNRLVNLDDIDKAFSNIEKRRKKVKTDLEYSQQALNELKEEYQQYKGLEQLEIELIELEEIQHSINSTDNLIDNILDTISNIEHIQKKIDNYPDTKVLEKDLKELEQLNKQYNDQKELLIDIRTLIEKIEIKQKTINYNDDKIKDLEEKYNDSIPNECPIMESIGECPFDKGKQ